MLTTIKQLQLQSLDADQKAKNKPPAPVTTTPKQSAPKPSKPKPTPKSKPDGPTKNISIQHMSAAKPKLNNKVLYDVLLYLKENKGEWTMEQIASQVTGYNFKDPEIIGKLQSNPKILFNEGKYSFKPMYSVNNISELLDFANKMPNGLEVEQLKDSYKTVELDIKKLVEEKEIIIIKNEETKFDMAYPNYAHYRVPVSVEFVTLWNSVKTPDDVELEKQMIAAGISSTKEEARPVKRAPPKKKEQRKRKITKITNTHLTGVDIMKDYVTPQKNPSGKA